MKTANPLLLRWVPLMIPAILLQAAGLVGGAETKPGVPLAGSAACRLVIEGEAIETLILERRSEPGNPMRLDHPRRNVDVPAGEYRVQEVRLEGGYSCRPSPLVRSEDANGRIVTKSVGWFTVTADRPHVLRVGAPLKPTLIVRRSNRVLMMDYRLLDASGQELWTYFPDEDEGGRLASYSVYVGKRLVGSGFLGRYG